MSLPFDTATFLGVFADYNRAVWPAQILLYLLGLGLVLCSVRVSSRAARLVPLGLAALWVWMAIGYHFSFFRRINPAATVFAVAFLGEAAMLIVWGRKTRILAFRPATALHRWLGALMLLYAFLLYPALNVALGHRYPAMPTFGLPCPTTIATLGLLVWASAQPPWWLWVVPLGWAAIGTLAAFALGMREDLGLLASALLAVGLMGPWARRGVPAELSSGDSQSCALKEKSR
jgi:hypothetical protein